jgi:hypothetical protein
MKIVLKKKALPKPYALQKVETALNGAGCGPPHGSSWRCPAHDDSTPSLSVNYKDGKVLMCCHAGCSIDAIVAKIGLAMSDLFGPEASYEYHRLDGGLAYVVDRWAGKHFRARRLGADGNWVPNLEGVERILYRLPEVTDAISSGAPIYVVEGEKDADCLITLGITATTSPFGAGSWSPKYAAHLKGASMIYVVADADEVGRKHAKNVAASLEAAGVPFELLESPIGKDVSDLIESGRSPDDLIAMKPSGENEQASAGLTLTPIGELLEIEPEPLCWLLEGRLLLGGTSIVAGPPKAGKSTFVRELCVSVAHGGSFLGWKVEQGAVFYLALEGRPEDHVEAFRSLGATQESPIYLFCGIAPERALQHLRKQMKALSPRLVVVDTMQRLVKVADASAYAETTVALDEIIDLANSTGAHVLLVHHHRKTGGDVISAVLGSTGIAASVDTILGITRAGSMRMIESRQRIGADIEPAEFLELDSKTGRLRRGGTAAEAGHEAAKQKLLECIKGSGAWLTQQEIRENVGMQWAPAREALTAMAEAGELLVIGSGKKGDPKRYCGFFTETDSHGSATVKPWFPKPGNQIEEE